MKLLHILNKTVLFIAAEKQNSDIVKVLMSNKKIDPNIINILNNIFYVI